MMGNVGTQLGFLIQTSTSAERDNAANRVVRGDTDGDAISGNHLDPKAPHAAAQLRQHLVACVALDAIETAGVDGDDCSLHIYEIVFAQ
jgi:xanthine/CO dehydrogenase XdhC/CoxF family maturation factor